MVAVTAPEGDHRLIVRLRVATGGTPTAAAAAVTPTIIILVIVSIIVAAVQGT